MATLKILFVLVFARHVLSNGDAFLPSIDPLFAPSLETGYPNDYGLTLYYKNLNITGMNDRQLIESEVKIEDKSVFKKYKVKLHVVGDITFALRKQSKSFSGGFTLVTDLTYSFKYIYEINQDYKTGIKKAAIVQEFYYCDDVRDPQITVSSDLAEALKNDPATVNLNPKLEDLEKMREVMICTIGAVTFPALVDSYRVVARNSSDAEFFERTKN